MRGRERLSGAETRRHLVSSTGQRRHIRRVWLGINNRRPRDIASAVHLSQVFVERSYKCNVETVPDTRSETTNGRDSGFIASSYMLYPFDRLPVIICVDLTLRGRIWRGKRQSAEPKSSEVTVRQVCSRQLWLLNCERVYNLSSGRPPRFPLVASRRGVFANHLISCVSHVSTGL